MIINKVEVQEVQKIRRILKRSFKFIQVESNILKGKSNNRKKVEAKVKERGMKYINMNKKFKENLNRMMEINK